MAFETRPSLTSCRSGEAIIRYDPVCLGTDSDTGLTEDAIFMHLPQSSSSDAIKYDVGLRLIRTAEAAASSP
jgi:hypothetical protein